MLVVRAFGGIGRTDVARRTRAFDRNVKIRFDRVIRVCGGGVLRGGAGGSRGLGRRRGARYGVNRHRLFGRQFWGGFSHGRYPVGGGLRLSFVFLQQGLQRFKLLANGVVL